MDLWPNRDAAFVDIVQGIRQIIDEIASHEATFTQLAYQSVILYDPPDPYDNLFTDRELILDDISSFFAANHHGQTAIQTLIGLVGIGKTAIAKGYCEQFFALYEDILWFNASTRARLSSYVTPLANQLSLPTAIRENERQFFDAVKQWLRDRPRWLLVLDDLEDMTLLDLLVPPRSNGHVLLTMRKTATWKRGREIFVPSMDLDAGTLLLLRRIQALPAQ